MKKKKYLTAPLAGPIFIFLIAFVSCTTPPEIKHGRITRMFGEVSINHNKQDKTAEIGELVYKDDVISTSANSYCDLQFGKTVVRVSPGSKLVIKQVLQDNVLSKERLELFLALGKVFNKVLRVKEDFNMAVYTPTAVIGVRGTEFMVEHDLKKTKVFTRTGKVNVRLNLEGSKELQMTKQGDDAAGANILEQINPRVDVVKDEQVIIEKKHFDKAVLKIKNKILSPRIIESEKQDIKKQLNGIVVKKTLISVPPEIENQFEQIQSGFLEESSESETPSLKIWPVKKGVKVKGEFILQKSVLCLAEENGKISAYKKGRLLWKTDTGHLINSSPVFYNNKIIIGGNDEELKGIDINTGKILWKQKIGSLLYSKPVISAGRIYTGTATGTMYALNPETGAVIWQHKIGSGIFVTPAVDEANVYFCAENNYAFALNKKSGKLVWKQDTGTKIVASSPQIFNTRLYFGNYKGAVLCLSKKSGKVLWKKYLKGRILAPVSIGMADKKQALYAGTVTGNFYRINPGTGKVLWNKNLNSSIMAQPLIIDNRAYVGLQNGRVVLLDPSTGEERDKKKFAGAVNSMFVSKGNVFVSTDKGVFQIK